MDEDSSSDLEEYYMKPRPTRTRRKYTKFIPLAIISLVAVATISLSFYYFYSYVKEAESTSDFSRINRVTSEISNFIHKVTRPLTSTTTEVTTNDVTTGYPTTSPLPSTESTTTTQLFVPTTEATPDMTLITSENSVIPNGANDLNVCMSNTCIEYAAHVTQNMDARVDPCDDFYRFACGNFEKLNPIENSSYYIDNLTKLEKSTYDSLSDLLMQQRPEALLNVPQKFYSFCHRQPVDLSLYFKEFIQSLFKSNDWTKIWATILIYDLKNVIKLGLGKSELDSNVDELHLRNNSKINKEWRNTESYKRFIQESFSLFFGKDPNSYKETSERIVEFEKEFAHPTGLYSSVHNEDFVWANLAKEVLQQVNVSNYVIGQVNFNIPYLHIYRTYGANGVITGYLKWVVIRELGFLSGNAFRSIESKYSSPSKLADRCKDFLLKYSSDLIYKLYIDAHLTPEKVSGFKEIVEDEKKVFSQLIKSQSWTDEDVKELMQEKLESLKLDIGHPGWNLNESVLFNKYKSVIQLYQNYSHRRFFYILSTMIKVDTRSSFDEFATTKKTKDKFLQADMSYYHKRNEISVTALYLDSFVYHPALPMYVNYAGIGSNLGHEFTHGFIGEPGEFDAFGERDFQLIINSAEVDERSKCFVSLYNRTRDDLTGLNLNGVRTRYENIADITGLKVARLAYQKHSFTDKVLPGLEKFTHDQMFYIAYANNWCENRGKTSMNNSIVQSKNAPPKYRVNIPLKNSQHFSEVFNCQWKPKKTCEVW